MLPISNTRPRLSGALLVGLLASLWVPTALGEKKPKDLAAVARDVYVYGYPLVTMETTRRVMTNTVEAKGKHAPMGQFSNQPTYPDASFRDVTAPNADTLYSTAWIDLSQEPYVLHVPDVGNRYYLIPMLSAWTEVFGNPGTRTTGTKEGDFLITGPQWKGQAPKGMTHYKSPTNIVWLLGRTYSTGTKEDYAEVHRLQQQYKLTPLSQFGKSYTPPPGKVDASIDMKTAVRDQVDRMDGPTFFKAMAEAMKANPPVAVDSPMVVEMAKLGMVPGESFDAGKAEPSVLQAIQQAPKAGAQTIMAGKTNAVHAVNGWLMLLESGTYGVKYADRAFVAAGGLGANRPEDAFYPVTETDHSGQALTGSKRYVLRFPKGQTPPVNGFWSLTMYDKKLFFVKNPLNKYTVSERNNLKTNSDGSLDIYVQNESPGPEKQNNWLPAPSGDFVLMLRTYWPSEEILNGSWKPPPVQVNEEGYGGSPPRKDAPPKRK